MRIGRFICLGTVWALPTIVACAQSASGTAPHVVTIVRAIEPRSNNLTLLVPAADKRFQYEGRIDFSNSNAPVIIWQATRISLDFDGPSVRLLFDRAKGQNYFNAQLDGSNTVVEVNEGTPVRPAVLAAAGPARHHLVLFKRSEASAGTARFRGVILSAGSEAWAPKKPSYRLAMEFIGDSITVGACNEDGPEDQWDNRRTHNCALSYATLTAQAFNADYRNIAVSGMGVAAGWVPMLAGETWNRLYPSPDSQFADLGEWKPNVVFVNFGENDGSYPTARGQPFPTNFGANYVHLIDGIRSAYPKAQIVLLRGGMFNGARNPALRKAWEVAVSKLESGDKFVSHFVFRHWTSNHPRVPDDRILSSELTQWLKQQSFMQPYRQPIRPRAVYDKKNPETAGRLPD